MTNISSIIQAYTPTTSSAPSVSAVTSAPANDPDAGQSQSQAPATNADTQAPAVYTALANASASTIRGSNLNTSA